jgi:hypothetical protein
MTHSLTLSHDQNSGDWQEDSFSPSERDPFLPPSPEETITDVIHHRYMIGASKKPLGTWVRNSSITIGQAPFTSMTIPTNLYLNLNHSSRHGKMKTHQLTKPQQ